MVALVMTQIHTRSVVLALVVLALPGSRHEGVTSRMASTDDDLCLLLEAPSRASLGVEIPVEVVLSSEKGRDIVTLDTARLEFTLEQLLPTGNRLVIGHHLQGDVRQVATRLPSGEELIDVIAVKKLTEFLESGRKVAKRFELTNLLGNGIGRGKYHLTIDYEKGRTAGADFEVVLYYKESVPTLIARLEQGSFEQRVWARNTLKEITGMPDWLPTRSDSVETIKVEVEKVRSWWLEHKMLIELINRQLVPMDEDGDE